MDKDDLMRVKQELSELFYSLKILNPQDVGRQGGIANEIYSRMLQFTVFSSVGEVSLMELFFMFTTYIQTYTALQKRKLEFLLVDNNIKECTLAQLRTVGDEIAQEIRNYEMLLEELQLRATDRKSEDAPDELSAKDVTDGQRLEKIIHEIEEHDAAECAEFDELVDSLRLIIRLKKDGNVAGAIAVAKNKIDASKNDVMRAELLTELGNTYVEASDYAEAMRCYQQAVKVREAIGDTNSGAVAIIHHNISVIYIHEKEFGAALTHAQQALAIKGKDSPNSLLYAKELCCIAHIHTQTGAYKDALAACNDAMKIYNIPETVHPVDAVRLKCINRQSFILTKMDKLTEARAEMEKALQLIHKAMYPHAPPQSSIVNLVGMVVGGSTENTKQLNYKQEHIFEFPQTLPPVVEECMKHYAYVLTLMKERRAEEIVRRWVSVCENYRKRHVLASQLRHLDSATAATTAPKSRASHKYTTDPFSTRKGNTCSVRLDIQQTLSPTDHSTFTSSVDFATSPCTDEGSAYNGANSTAQTTTPDISRPPVNATSSSSNFTTEPSTRKQGTISKALKFFFK